MSRAFFCLLGVFTLKVSSLIFAQGQPVAKSTEFDVLIKNGIVYDGTGAEPKHADVAIRGDRIAGVGDFKTAKAKTIIDANGLAVAPGFINMLSWSVASLIQDGRSQSEIRQGVTTEIMGEAAGFPATSPHSSAQPRSVRTWSASKINRRRRNNSSKCASSCAKKWKRARWGLALP